MKSRIVRSMLALPLLGALGLSAGTVPASMNLLPRTAIVKNGNFYYDTVRKRRRSKKKSAAIVGGSALGGAVIGKVAGGKKGAVIGGLAGAGTGVVYDQKTKQK